MMYPEPKVNKHDLLWKLGQCEKAFWKAKCTVGYTDIASEGAI